MTHSVASATNLKDYKKKLVNAKEKIDEIISKFNSRWQINEYPDFLKSVAMTKTSWEVLKVVLLELRCQKYFINYFVLVKHS